MEFSQFARVVEEGRQKSLHWGVQLSVSVGSQVFEEAFGTFDEVRPLHISDCMSWLSAGKPVTAVAILKLLEDRTETVETTLGEVLEEAQGQPVEKIRLVELLTHSSPLQEFSTGWPGSDWEEVIARICHSELDTSWDSQTAAAYLPSVSWFLLGRVVEVLSGQSFEDYVHSKILAPIGLEHTSCLPVDKPCQLWDRVKGSLEPSPYQEKLESQIPSPGSGFRGPSFELRKFYDSLRGEDAIASPLLEPETIEAMTKRVREGRFDKTLHHQVDYGLGVIIDSNRYGKGTVPYGFGEQCSETAFGHGGSQCAIGFADPGRKRSVAIVANGRPGEGQHQRRFRQLLAALEEDLKAAGL